MKLHITDKIVVKALLFVAATVAIALSLPRDSQSLYNYEVNRPWTYPLLTAPFDIPVHLDSVSAAAVRDSINHTFEPVFYRDATVEKTMVSELASRLNTDPDIHLSPTDRNKLLEAVKKEYSDGIVSQNAYSLITEGSLPMVRFIHDNVAISIPTDKYLSSMTAYSQLTDQFRTNEFREAITLADAAELLQPNILLDTLETHRLLNDLYQRAMAPVGVIQTGERIIDRGDIVTLSLATVLQTYEAMVKDRGIGGVSSRHYPLIGQVLFIVMMFSVLYIYFWSFRRKYFDDNKAMTFVMLVVTAFAVAALLCSTGFRSALYVVPYTIVPIMTMIFLDSRSALIVHLVQVLIVAIITTFAFEFIALQFLAGCVAIDSMKDLSRRSQLVRTALLVFLIYCVGYVALELCQVGTLDRTVYRMIGYFGINAVLVSFAYILLFLVEKVFGFTSRVTLVELSDINNPLLRELSEECPGTFQHSMAVSNLASAAAARIGANVQLVRAGALYHDIGKTCNPAFYTENQHGINPHDALDPEQSARIIIGHVTEGLKMAEKAKLPAVIRSFIREHHGAGQAKYFYNTYCNSHPEVKPDPAPFTYPGPNPQSRETSILMMADAVEASSRSLTDYSPEAISALVNKIVDGQVKEGLHNDSSLSFHDVKTIKDTFVSRLRTMYHTRISYPDLKPRPQQEEEDTDEITK